MASPSRAVRLRRQVHADGVPWRDIAARVRHFTADRPALATAEGRLRVATWNVGLERAGPGLLLRDILTGKDAQVAAAVLPGFRFNPLDTTTGTTHNIDPGEKGVMADYRRVFWMWDKKFRFTVDVMAVGLPETALTAFQNYPFFKKIDGVLDGSVKQTQTAAGIRRVLDLWLAEGERLEVGTLYRTPDRRYTLNKVSNAINNFSPITRESLSNTTYGGRVAKSLLAAS